MSFSNIKDVLSRDEMKMIMAGSEGGGGGTGYYCAQLNLCLNQISSLCSGQTDMDTCHGVQEMTCFARWGAACMYGA